MGNWKNLDAAFAELEAECTNIVRGLTVRLFNSLLSRTPQYLGRMTASWTYSLNAPDFVNRSSLVDPENGTGEFTHLGYYRHGVTPLYKGHPTAIGIANAGSVGRDRAFRLGDTVYFSNGVDHGEGSYAQAVEDGNIQLRSVNQPGAPAARTFDWAGVYYEMITPTKAVTLKSLSIGDADAGSSS